MAKWVYDFGNGKARHFFEVDARCDTVRVADLALKESSLYMSKSLNQVPGFWFLMPTFLTNSFGSFAANLVLVLRLTVGQR